MKSTTQTVAMKMAKETANEIIERNIARAIELKKKIDEFKEELDGIKIYFKNEVFGEGRSENRLATSKGTVILKTTNKYSIEPANIPQFKKIFGEIYGDMVTEKTAYSPTAALKKKMSDGDYKHAKFIREAVTTTTSNSVEFEEVAIAGLKLVKGGKK